LKKLKLTETKPPQLVGWCEEMQIGVVWPAEEVNDFGITVFMCARV